MIAQDAPYFGDRGAIRHTTDEIRELMPLSPPTQEPDRVSDYCLLAFGTVARDSAFALGAGVAALCSRRAAPLRASTFCAAAWRLGSRAGGRAISRVVSEIALRGWV